MAVSEVYADRGYNSGVPIEDYKLDDEVISLLHLIRVQAVPFNTPGGAWAWQVQSCHSHWAIMVPSGSTLAEWKTHLASLIEARSK